jgi:biotin carboxyl carrier protein
VKYHVRLGSRTVEVEVDGGLVSVDGEPFEAHVASVPGTPLHHLLLAGESWTIAAQPLAGPGEAGGSRWALGAVGERIEVEVVDDRTRQIQSLTSRRAGGPGGGVVRAPMPGLVVRVEVSEGERVSAGAGLVVVEAMKMENELRAARPGVVAKVHVQPGSIVEKGAPLVTLDPLRGVEPSS